MTIFNHAFREYEDRERLLRLLHNPQFVLDQERTTPSRRMEEQPRLEGFAVVLYCRVTSIAEYPMLAKSTRKHQ